MKSKIINLEQVIKKKNQEKEKLNNSAKNINLYWLHCSKCNSTEYSFKDAPSGRIHNKCGTQIIETIVSIDPILEYKSAKYNYYMASNLLLDEKILNDPEFNEMHSYILNVSNMSKSFIDYCDDKLKLNEIVEFKNLSQIQNHLKELIDLNYKFDKIYFIIGVYFKFPE